jgi:phosphatidylinositol kinase/protein kinase (PI-3  family)
MSDKQQAKLLKYYQTSIQNQKLPGTPDLLKSYSPWLSTFQSTNFKEQIEIPGQYHGRSRPDPESHVKIASFDDRVLVMGSLRKPKRLRINGTDGNESLFLVKVSIRRLGEMDKHTDLFAFW